MNEQAVNTDSALGTGPETAGSWKNNHPVNIRMVIPWFGGRRFYLTLVSGEDRRSPERLDKDRSRNPVSTLNNILFILGVLALIYMAGIFGVFFYSSILEM